MNLTGTQHVHPIIRRGFTLTELLVVILIIAVLAALSFSGVRELRSAADKTNSIRNLAQLQIANASYSSENAGKYVPYVVYNEQGNREGFWYQVPEFLVYFRGEVYDAKGEPSKTVPLSMLDPKVVRARLPFYSSMAGSYGLNNTGLPTSGSSARPAFTVASITKPEQSMAFASATDVRVAYPARFSWKGIEGKTTDGGLAYRHNDKALVVYFDGHVGEMSKSEIKEIDTARGGRTGPFWTPNQN